MILTGEKGGTLRKLFIVPLGPPQITCGLPLDGTKAASVTGRGMTTCNLKSKINKHFI